MADTSPVLVEFGAKLDNLLSGITEAKSAIGDFAATAVEAFAAGFAVDKIENFVNSMTEMNVQTQRASAILGVSTSAVAGLSVLAQVSGGSIESLSMAIMRLGRNLATAQSSGVSPAASALKALGLNIKEFNSLDTESKIGALADKFAVLKDGTDKDAIAIALLGRAGAQMIPTFNEGSAAMVEYAAIAERAGSKSFPEFEAAAHELHLQTIELSQSFTGAGMSIFTGFQPALSGLYKIMTDLVQSFTNSVREGGAMGVLMNTLTIAAQGLATALVISIKAIETLWEVVKSAVFAMGEEFVALGRIIGDVFTFNWGDIAAAWSSMQTQMTARTQIMATDMNSIFKRAVDELKTIWQGGADAVVKIEQTKTARLNLANKDAISAAISAAQERIKIADMEYQQTADHIKNQYGTFFLTEGLKTQALLAALDKRHGIEMAAVADEIKVSAGSAAAYQKALNEKLTLDQKYQMDRQKILEAMAKDEEKSWTEGLSTITSSFNTQLRGLLAGTTSFATATKAILGDMIIKAIELFEKMVVSWVAKELAQTAATTAGVTARTAAETTGASVGLVAQIGNALAVIMADAAKTFAGVFAFLAPVMGPAAAAPATASMTMVLGAAGALAVPTLAVGSDYVASTGLAIIHQGEAIVPAQANTPYSGGGGGATVNLNVQAIDAKSFATMMNSNSGILTNLIKRAIRDGQLNLATAG